MARRGARSVTVLNRTSERAHELCDRMSKAFPKVRFASMKFGTEAFHDVAPLSELVVNCTSGAAASEIERFDVEELPSDDIIGPEAL